MRKVRITLVTISVIAAFIVAGRMRDSLPSDYAFPGWITVLQPVGDESHAVRLGASAGPGVWNGSRNVTLNVSICGDGPYQGVLLLGGGARLSKAEILDREGPPSEANWRRIRPTELGPDLVNISTGEVPTVVGAQAFNIRLDTVPPCYDTKAEGASLEDFFVGAPYVVRGLLQEPVVRSQELGPLKGAYLSQSWPIIGAFSEYPRNNLGVFQGKRVLAGEWVRSPKFLTTIEGGRLGSTRAVDVARPPSDSTSVNLRWSARGALEASGRIQDVELANLWGSVQLALTAALAIIGSVAANHLVIGRSESAGGRTESGGGEVEISRGEKMEAGPGAKVIASKRRRWLGAAVLLAGLLSRIGPLRRNSGRLNR